MIKNLSPVRFRTKRPKPAMDYQDINLTAKQWRALTLYLKLPDTARPEVESTINDFRFENMMARDRPIPTEIKVELNRLTSLAKKLKEGLHNPISPDLVYTIGAVDRLPEPYAQASYTTHYDEIRKSAGTLLGILKKAKRNIAPKPSGADVQIIDKLVRNLDAILYRHTGNRLNRGKASLKFLEEIKNITGLHIGIHEALVRLAAHRKNSSV